MRILIAETEPAFRAEMKQALEQVGHEVISTSDGGFGWTYLTGPLSPDLLITGLQLGTGRPPGTALGARAHAQKPSIPVIYIPATLELAQFANPQHGAVLLRPFAVSRLVAVVHRFEPDLRLPLSRPRRLGVMRHIRTSMVGRFNAWFSRSTSDSRSVPADHSISSVTH